MSRASSLPKLHSPSEIGLNLQQMPFDFTLCSGDSSLRYGESFLLTLVLFKIKWHSPEEQLEGIWEWCAVRWGLQGNLFILCIKVEHTCQKAPSEVVLLLCVLNLLDEVENTRMGSGWQYASKQAKVSMEEALNTVQHQCPAWGRQ